MNFHNENSMMNQTLNKQIDDDQDEIKGESEYELTPSKSE